MFLDMEFIRNRRRATARSLGDEGFKLVQPTVKMGAFGAN
jgi:hypothetical protein